MMGACDKINAISLNVEINKRKSVNLWRYKLPINVQIFMQTDSAQAKLSLKVVGGLLFDSPCRYCHPICLYGIYVYCVGLCVVACVHNNK